VNQKSKHGGKRPGSGPKPGPNGPLELIGFRADRLVRAQIALLAREGNKTASQWIRDACLEKVARTLAGVR
jgi:hypothetical protein